MSQGVRRSGRIAKEVPILLIGSDTEGKVFSEETKTVVLSRHGAGILSRHKLAPEDEVVIRSGESKKEAIAHVVGQIGAESGVYTYGIAFVDQTLHFWNIQLPPPTPSEMKSLSLALQCSTCGEHVTLDNAEEAADVYAINEGIVRYCQNCGFSTVWKIATEPPAGSMLPKRVQTSPGVPHFVVSTPVRQPISNPPSAPELEAAEPSAYSASAIALDEFPEPQTSVPPPVTLAPVVVAPAATGINRRKYVRARVTVAACVRTEGFGDDITICEDISRGGLRFKSRKEYPVGTEIEVAVPYSPETQSIFVRGRVVFVQGLPDQSMTRHGVCYLPAAAK
jgi:hypothetical protein